MATCALWVDALRSGLAKTAVEILAKIGQDGFLEPFTWIEFGANVAAGQRVPAGAIIGRGSNLDGRKTR